MKLINVPIDIIIHIAEYLCIFGFHEKLDAHNTKYQRFISTCKYFYDNLKYRNIILLISRVPVIDKNFDKLSSERQRQFIIKELEHIYKEKQNEIAENRSLIRFLHIAYPIQMKIDMSFLKKLNDCNNLSSIHFRFTNIPINNDNLKQIMYLKNIPSLKNLHLDFKSTRFEDKHFEYLRINNFKCLDVLMCNFDDNYITSKGLLYLLEDALGIEEINKLIVKIRYNKIGYVGTIYDYINNNCYNANMQNINKSGYKIPSNYRLLIMLDRNHIWTE